MADWYFRSSKPNNLIVCPGCRNLVRRNEEFCPFCARRLRAAGGAQAWLSRAFSSPDSMTRFLLGMMALGFILQIVADFFLPEQFRDRAGRGILGAFMGANALTYIRMGSNFQFLVAVHHEYWRWVTYCFLHIGILHILFNSWAMWDLGRLAERLWGTRQVFATFILTGIAGGALSFAWNIFVLGRPANSAGASGAICGILGLLLGAYYKNRYHVGEFLGSQLIRWAVMILVFGLVVGADNGAHVGGMLAGAVLGYCLPPTNTTKTPDRDGKAWRALAWLSLILLVVSVACAVWFYAQGPVYAGLKSLLLRTVAH
ncbi:MAG: rhomboid family intramembrane serine protease [Planctomycetota bacterium]|jgi:rhomboid protease GluP|nr:rhomboid family intramembrane serine protease [Planctomycetota bacterium]